MVADHRDGQGGRFVNWRAAAAVALAARDDPGLTDADVRLLLELASWTDLDTGWCRRILRQLAAGVHQEAHGPIWRRLARLVARGLVERRGTGRPGYPSAATTEQYRISWPPRPQLERERENQRRLACAVA